MIENRRHFRLREFIDVAWKVADQGDSGVGMVVNISPAGLLLQTDRVFRPSDNCILAIETDAQSLPFAPPFAAIKGKIMWFRRIHTPQERLQCGIQFLTDYPDKGFQQWLEMKVDRLSDATNANILNNLAL